MSDFDAEFDNYTADFYNADFADAIQEFFTNPEYRSYLPDWACKIFHVVDDSADNYRNGNDLGYETRYDNQSITTELEQSLSADDKFEKESDVWNWQESGQNKKQAESEPEQDATQPEDVTLQQETEEEAGSMSSKLPGIVFAGAVAAVAAVAFVWKFMSSGE